MIEIDALLKPISDAQPEGDDARYEFNYELMEAEVKKFGSLFGETVDWKVVKTHALDVLLAHSKDLKAMCYLTRALAEEHKLNGVEQGLKLIAEAISQYGEKLYPQRKRGRDGAVEWLNHQLKLLLAKYSELDCDWNAASACLSETERVQAQFDLVFADSEADFFDIRNELNALMQRVGNAAPISNESDNVTNNGIAASTEEQAQSPTVVESAPAPQASSPEPSAGLQPTAAQAVVAKKAPVKEVDLDTDFSSPTASKRTLKKVAETMLHANPSDPLAYRIYRHLTWDDVDSLPDNQNQQTPLILAVSQDQQADYRDKAQQESDVDTIKRLERTLTDAPFWLTGHYLVYSMLKNLGYELAASAVKEETLAFIDQFKGIETLQFKNSVPFADEATQSWLSTRVASGAPSAAIVQNVTLIEQDALPVDEITLETLGEFTAEVAKRLEQDHSGRGQFLLYLQLVTAYHSVGLFTLCLPYLEKIWLVRKEISLSSWEPHLSLQLDALSEKTLKELYENKEQLPEKYQDWKNIYD